MYKLRTLCSVYHVNMCDNLMNLFVVDGEARLLLSDVDFLTHQFCLTELCH